MSWAEERARFPVLDHHAFLNAGSFGPLSRGTLDAMAAVRAWEAEHGRAGKAYFDGMLEQRERIRALVAAQIGVAPANIALTDSTTQSVHVVVTGLGLAPGDQVVTTDSEHLGLAGPLAASGAELRIARIHDLRAADVFDAVRDLVTPRTRLLALSAISWIDGKVLPWRELRAETGVPVLVDGAQSVGALEVVAGEADFYTVSCQKWLCGPDATGALYVREPEALPVRMLSYPGIATYDGAVGTWEPKAGATRFDSPFRPVSSLAGLETALGELPDGRFERARELAERCRTLLLEAGRDVVTEPGQSTLVSFRAPDSATETSAALYERGVIVRDLPNTDLVRASVGWWNDESDLQRLVDGLRGA